MKCIWISATAQAIASWSPIQLDSIRNKEEDDEKQSEAEEFKMMENQIDETVTLREVGLSHVTDQRQFAG